MDNSYTLIGAPVSLYTGKVRAYLRFKNIPYHEKLSTFRVIRKELVPNIGKAIVPVIKSPSGEYIQDTTVIIDYLEKRFPEYSIYPTTPKQHLTALLLETYGDEWLLMPAMHYRWWYKKDNLFFILQEFGSTLQPTWPKLLRYIAGMPMAATFGGIAPKFVLGATRKIRPALEAWTEEFLRLFNKHLEHHPFLLGTRPCIGDFGFMAPLYAHLYRDPYPGKLMQKIAPNVCKWVERMNAPKPDSGEFLPDDTVPETLEPILKMMFKEHFPVIIDTIHKTEQWCKRHPNAQSVKRYIGRHKFYIGGICEKRDIHTYTQWMAQRPIFYYQNLSEEQKADVDIWLKELGGYKELNTPINIPLKYENHRTKVAKKE